jgi:hypothetical protein
MEDDKYKLKYSFTAQSGKFTKEDVKENEGLCDSIIVISIISQVNGSYTQALLSADGEKSKQMCQRDLFKAWMAFGMSFEDNGDELFSWQKHLVKIISGMFRDVIINGDDQ